MPEEEALPQADTPDAPVEAAPEGTPAEKTQEQIDWEKRYNDLRPEFDRTNQRVSQFEEFYGQLVNPETQAEALRQLGLELEAEDTEDDEFQDPDEELRKRLEGMESYLSEQEQMREEQEYAALEQQYLEQELEKLGELDKMEREAVQNLAFAYPDDEGLPDVAKAHSLLTDLFEAKRKGYIDSKKATKVVADGIAGLDKADLNDEDTRLKLAAQIIEAESPAE